MRGTRRGDRPSPSARSRSSTIVVRSQPDLKAVFDHEVEVLGSEVAAFPWEDRAAYAQWLVNTRAYVHHTTRLTALAAAHLPAHEEALHERLLRHAAEELGHEKLLIEDLEALKVRPDAHAPLPVTIAFAQCLYYQIAHVSPFALFGRVLPLEGVSARESAGARARVVAAHGEGVDAFLAAHGSADPAHVAEAFAALANVGSPHDEIIVAGMRLTSALYRSILAEIVTTTS
jgi:hypothetical protein